MDAAAAWPLTRLLRRGCRRGHYASPFGDVDALPDEATAAILARLPADAVGALSLASRSWRSAVSRALEDLRPVSLWPPPPSITNAAISPFAGVARLVLLPHWLPPPSSEAPVPHLFGGREGLSALLRALPLLCDCTLDLRRTLDALSPQTAWPRGLTSLTLACAGLDDFASVDASPALRHGLRRLSLLLQDVIWVGSTPNPVDWPARKGEGGLGPAPPLLEGFVALRELRLVAPSRLCWRVCRETVARLTSLRLRQADNNAGCAMYTPLLPPGGALPVQNEDDGEDFGDAVLPLWMAAPAAELLRPRPLAAGGGAWPNLRHLEVPDDGFRSGDALPALRPLLFSDAFPNLEALSVATAPGRAPALAATLAGLKRLRRLVIRHVDYCDLIEFLIFESPVNARGQLAEAAFAAAVAAYRGGGGGDDATSGSSRAHALALGGLAPLSRALLSSDGALELIVA